MPLTQVVIDLVNLTLGYAIGDTICPEVQDLLSPIEMNQCAHVRSYEEGRLGGVFLPPSLPFQDLQTYISAHIL